MLVLLSCCLRRTPTSLIFRLPENWTKRSFRGFLCGKRNLSKDRAQFSQQLRRSSTDTTDALNKESIRKAPATKFEPKPLFPWRHEYELIPRLVPGTSEYDDDVVLTQRAQSGIAYSFLDNVSLLNAFLTKKWQVDLAEGAAYAFSRAVAGICANTYHVPMDTISSADGSTHFHFDPSQQMGKHASDPVECPTLKYMVGKKLRQLYESAHGSAREQLQIRLELEPTRADFVALFCSPYISRKAVEQDPTVIDIAADAILDMRAGGALSGSSAFWRFATYITEYEEANNGSLFTTVDAQVLVECQEIFSVRDSCTGRVLQGSEEGLRRTVRHLVRFETTVETTGGPNILFNSNKAEDWVLIDIDDLVGEDPWYMDLAKKLR